MNTNQSMWALQDAKARFSELVRRAQTEGPQTVTVHGKPAVTITKAEMEPMLSGMSGADFLRALQFGAPIDFDIPDWETEGAFRDVALE